MDSTSNIQNKVYELYNKIHNYTYFIDRVCQSHGLSIYCNNERITFDEYYMGNIPSAVEVINTTLQELKDTNKQLIDRLNYLESLISNK